jgi:heavy metal sensor kinase
MRMSIRRRLALWNTLAFGVLLAGFAGLVYALAHRAAFGVVDQKLAGCLDQLGRDDRPASDPDRLRYLVEEFWEHEQVGCVVFDAAGRPFLRTEELTADAVPEWPGEVGTEVEVATVTRPVIGRQRAMTALLPHSSDGRTVVLLASTAEADHGLGHLRVALLTAIPAVLAAAAVAAYLLAGRALGPVSRLTEATRLITAARLSDRLPVADAHDELGRLAATVNDLIARLEAAFAEQRRFTADASHELRTPLAVLRTEVEVALRTPPGAAEVPGLLASLLEECVRLGALTDRLLTLARLDSSEPSEGWEPVHLIGLLAGAIDGLRPLADAKGVTLRIDPDDSAPVVVGDPDGLLRAFANLVENGVKYTPPGGSVVVRVSTAVGAVRVEVTDTGEGIPPEHLPRVFDRFYRVDKARSRSQGGAGLGLSIARGVITDHGGEIGLASVAGRGTTATVLLPLAGATG